MSQAESPASAGTDSLRAQLKGLLGPDEVIDDPGELAFYSADVYAPGRTAALAIRPSGRDAVPEAIALITGAGHAVVARGGGMSYTGGYTPAIERTVVIDLSALDQILEVDEEDRVVTVEAGVTWKQIWDELRPRGLRLPFFGTFSGSRATVGGGLSNGALFFGTARYGTAAEIVVGMEVADARGRLIRTGQAAFHNGRPAFRNYGPDLTGLFTHDAGALGVKLTATVRMIEEPAETGYLSFAFGDQGAAVSALSDIGRSGAAEEAYLFDPATTARSLDPASLREDLRRLKSVIGGERSLLRGLREGARVAAAGRDFVNADLYTLHLVCAARSTAALEADLAHCRSIAEHNGGGAIADTIPRAARSEPFAPLNGILGAEGERWAALNAKIPHSDAPRLIAATERLLDGYAARMAQSGVSTSFLFIAISDHVFSYEPVLRWRDAWLPVHRRTPERAFLDKLAEPPPNQVVRDLVDEIRTAIVRLFADFGAASNQIGKTYPLLSSMNAETRAVLEALKAELDPDGLMNPGALRGLA